MKKKFKVNTGYLFILPHYLLFLIFIAIPTLFTIYVSFTNWDLFGTPIFVGLDNYKMLLFEKGHTYNTYFWNGIKNTLIYVITSVPIGILVPLMFAGILNENPPGKRFMQAVLYFPSLLSVSTVVICWSWLFRTDVGVINHVIGIAVNWAGSQPFAWIAINILTIWWLVGGNMIIYLAGMSDISEELYESAEIDGASKWAQFRYITLPLIKPQIAVTLIFTIIGGYNVFGQTWMFNNGEPGESNKTILMYIRELAFGSGVSQSGIAATMAVVLGIIIIISSIVVNKLFNRGEE